MKKRRYKDNITNTYAIEEKGVGKWIYWEHGGNLISIKRVKNEYDYAENKVNYNRVKYSSSEF
jgi:hypothetical protein